MLDPAERRICLPLSPGEYFRSRSGSGQCTFQHIRAFRVACSLLQTLIPGAIAERTRQATARSYVLHADERRQFGSTTTLIAPPRRWTKVSSATAKFSNGKLCVTRSPTSSCLAAIRLIIFRDTFGLARDPKIAISLCTTYLNGMGSTT